MHSILPQLTLHQEIIKKWGGLIILGMAACKILLDTFTITYSVIQCQFFSQSNMCLPTDMSINVHMHIVKLILYV